MDRESSLAYVTKESTRVSGTGFSLGRKPVDRTKEADWDLIREQAVTGDFESIPSDIYIRYYRSLKSINSDHLSPTAVERTCKVFWGSTGSGKTHRAWEEAGLSAYVKDPVTKWWCGYRAQQNVIIDEYRGSINISHLLRWLDKYPVNVETKGSTAPLVASKLWITSNIHPREWYPDLDQETVAALLRRLVITHFVTMDDIRPE